MPVNPGCSKLTMLFADKSRYKNFQSIYADLRKLMEVVFVNFVGNGFNGHFAVRRKRQMLAQTIKSVGDVSSSQQKRCTSGKTHSSHLVLFEIRSNGINLGP